MDFKLTNKTITVKRQDGRTLILPPEIKVFQNNQGDYTETIFGEYPIKEEDLSTPTK